LFPVNETTSAALAGRFLRRCPAHRLELVSIPPTAQERSVVELVCPCEDLHYIHRGGRVWYWEVVDRMTGLVLWCATENGILSIGPRVNGLSRLPPEDARRAVLSHDGVRRRRPKGSEGIPVYHIALSRRRSERVY
jgi:hypothetical protein